jgi:hypothetical protein
MNIQHMDHAPRDGTWILLFGGQTSEDDNVNINRPVTAFWDGEYWRYTFWDGEWRDAYNHPTGWMSL